mmetsp:Transcript_10019/g.16927  ORF Transcript_10019/g.16927 Transcript_10019/m.16927 type:complete len:203 (-) Transcript_10019:6-614(-)
MPVLCIAYGPPVRRPVECCGRFAAAVDSYSAAVGNPSTGVMTRGDQPRVTRQGTSPKAAQPVPCHKREAHICAAARNVQGPLQVASRALLAQVCVAAAGLAGDEPHVCCRGGLCAAAPRCGRLRGGPSGSGSSDPQGSALPFVLRGSCWAVVRGPPHTRRLRGGPVQVALDALVHNNQLSLCTLGIQGLRYCQGFDCEWQGV